MNSIDKLTELFTKFPGIGPRQARRFVYFLLSRNRSYIEELGNAIENLQKEIIRCAECGRHFAKNGTAANLCSVCSDETRDSSMLMVVPRDVDLEAVEKSGGYHGHYFVLGGSIPILDKEPEKHVRLDALLDLIQRRSALSEVILAMNANQDGEHTAEYLKEKLSTTLPRQRLGKELAVTTLARGLSTGAELEYADPETLKSAFIHRTK